MVSAVAKIEPVMITIITAESKSVPTILRIFTAGFALFFFLFLLDFVSDLFFFFHNQNLSLKLFRQYPFTKKTGTFPPPVVLLQIIRRQSLHRQEAKLSWKD
jgi:hypothetical protein